MFSRQSEHSPLERVQQYVPDGSIEFFATKLVALPPRLIKTGFWLSTEECVVPEVRGCGSALRRNGGVVLVVELEATG